MHLIIAIMKYTTREIINRALKLTDFNDDFFIGNRELTHLLNDNWYEAYSILVNKEDKTFLKSDIFANEDELPGNLFKILAVKDRHNNLLQKTQDYDIINNVIYLKNLDKVTVEYYPNPNPLCLKNIEKEQMNYSDVVTKWEDGIITSTAVMDNNGSTLAALSDVNTYLSNGCIKSNVLYDYSGSAFTSAKLIEGNAITYDTVNIDTDVEDVLAVITNKSHSFFFILDNAGNLYNEEDELITASFSPKTLYCREDGLFYVSNNRLYRVLGKVIEEFPVSIYSVNGILDEDDAVVTVGSTYYRKGYGFDSLLEMPNQAFWSYFAYSIAESICNVVQRDSTVISGKKEELKTVFLESLQNDNNAVYQIRNVEDWRPW